MRLRVVTAVLAGCCAVGLADPSRAGEAEPDAASTLEGLMQSLAQSGGVRARFRETKHLALLQDPLQTEGVVTFAPPDRLARETTRPGRSRVVVVGTRVAIRDETGETVVALDANDPARHFVENLAVLLRGDLEALRARYEVEFRADASGWHLDLTPRSRVLRRLVKTLRAEGQGPELQRMELLETSGDATLTVFHDVQTGLDFDSAERARLFSIGAPAAP